MEISFMQICVLYGTVSDVKEVGISTVFTG